MTEIQIFLKEQREAFLSLDKDKIIAHLEKYDIQVPADETKFWALVHLTRIFMSGLSREDFELSWNWFLENDVSADIIFNNQDKNLYGR